jgi:uncharacterized membrane protein YbhN (UPF0104 family)
MLVLSIFAIGVGLPIGAAWYEYFIYVPLIYVIGAVPITPGGLGLIEMLYKMFFVAYNENSVLALALLARLVPITSSLPGLWVFMSGPRPPKGEAIKAKLETREMQSAVA